jgi:hypothetical protein
MFEFETIKVLFQFDCPKIIIKVLANKYSKTIILDKILLARKLIPSHL